MLFGLVGEEQSEGKREEKAEKSDCREQDRAQSKRRDVRVDVDVGRDRSPQFSNVWEGRKERRGGRGNEKKVEAHAEWFLPGAWLRWTDVPFRRCVRAFSASADGNDDDPNTPKLGSAS